MYINIVMEWCDGGDLGRAIGALGGEALSEDAVMAIFVQVGGKWGDWGKRGGVCVCVWGGWALGGGSGDGGVGVGRRGTGVWVASAWGLGGWGG